MNEDELRNRFVKLWSEFGAPVDIDADAEIEKLARLYGGDGRHYHTLTHVECCLAEFDEVRGIAEDPQILELALWYHDAIYNTMAHDNEDKSAELLADALSKAGASAPRIDLARKLILITKHSAVPDTKDEELMIDIDLSILGKPRDEFDEYEANVRKEYSWVPDANFGAARKVVLESFLAREFIFYSEHFREKFESQARENLERSIAALPR